MKRMISKIFAGLLLTSALIIPASAFAQDTARQQFMFAYKLMQRGDLAEAGQAFDDYLAKYPQDEQRGDAAYFRAALHRKAGETQKAADQLKDAPAPSRVPEYMSDLLYGQVLVDLSEFEKALEVLERLEPGDFPDAVAPSLQLLQGLAYRGTGNQAAATRYLATAAKAESPIRPTALLELGRSQARGGDAAAAIESLNQAVSTQNEAVGPEAARLAGDLAFSLGRFDQAAGFYDIVIERYQTRPEFGPAAVGRMWADLKAGRNVAVIETYNQLRDALPEAQRADAAYVAGSANQALGQHENAIDLLLKYIASGDEQPLQANALYKLAVSQLELERFDDLRRTVQHMDRNFAEAPQTTDASFLIASADANQGRAAAGVARLKSFIEAGPGNSYYRQALLRRAALFETNGEPEAAAADLKLYLDSLESPAEAPGVALRYIDLTHRLDQHEQAIATADALLAAEVSAEIEQEAMYRKGEALTRAGEFPEALAVFDQLQRKHPLNSFRHDVDLRRGLLLSRLGQPEKSMQVLIEVADNEALAIDQRVAALRIIAARMRDTDRPDDAAATLRRMETVADITALTDAELLWLADYELNNVNPDAAIAVLNTFERPDRKLSGADESEALYHRGRAAFAKGEYEKAHKSFFGVVALGRGFDLDARLYLARSEAALGNLDAALIELSDLINVQDGRVRAESLFETGNVHRLRADRLRRQGDTNAATQALLDGRAAYKRLVVLYLTVESLYPLQPQGLIHLSEIARQLGETETAYKELGELIQAFPDTPYASYAKAVLDQEQRSRPDDALVTLNRLDIDGLDPMLKQRVEDRLDQLEAMR
jgi:tetratricopeptide (TPR) repeat protein